MLAADVAGCRVFAQDALGYRLHEQIVLDSGRETGAWLSLTIMAHELIYIAERRRARPAAPSRVLGRHARGVLRAADLFLDHGVHIEAAPSKHAVAQGFFLYGYEPGGNRVEVTTGGYFVYDPDFQPVVWSEAERSRPGVGRATVESFHTYGTPPVEQPS